MAKIHVIVNKIWTHGDKTMKIDVFEVNQNMVKFRIKERATRERILRRDMWNIADVPMVISKWSPIVEESQLDIQSIPMWITLKHVPFRMFSWKGIGCIASVVGEPKRLHPDTILCKTFEEAKVFVEVDLSKDLPESFRFQSDKGVDATVDFIYPWLPKKCASCSKWGHLKNACFLNRGRRDTLPESESAKGEAGDIIIYDSLPSDIPEAVSPSTNHDIISKVNTEVHENSVVDTIEVISKSADVTLEVCNVGISGSKWSSQKISS